MNKIIPPQFNLNQRIAIIAPAYWLEKDKLEHVQKSLSGLGLKVYIHPQNYLRDNRFAGTDADRKKAFEEVFANPHVGAIFCARGGYGALRIVDDLDYDLIRSNPKIFMGYSDITALLISIYQKTGLITFHGPMVMDFLNLSANFIFDSFYYFKKRVINWDCNTVNILRQGIGIGELIGGNLAILVNLIGTKSDFITDGKILFIEDVDEYWYNIERMMVHLKRNGKLQNIKGLIVGKFTNMKDTSPQFGKTVAQIILEVCKEYDFPIITNFPCGHIKNQVILPVGERVILRCNKGEISLVIQDMEAP